MRTEDTIAAISTPIGKGGIGIIRVSGKESHRIAERVIRGYRKISETESHRAYNGYFINPESGEIIDEIMYIVMKSPNTYTREDIVEINTHGGIYLIKRALEIVLSQGARIAEAGEFTFRAFVNGRIDLTQAEAVADLIEAENERSMKTAAKQVSGELKQSIYKIRGEIIDIYSNSEAEIDFSDEEIEIEEKMMTINKLVEISKKLKKMVNSYQTGKYYKNGVKIGIFGRVNVGKSSLLNALIGNDRVIVSEEPGTTRDIIKEEISYTGVLLQFIDTAGIRESKGFIENEGIKRTKIIMDDSDIALLVIDSSDVREDEDLKIYNNLKRKFSGEKEIFIVYNKIDLIKNINQIKKIVYNKEVKNVFISAKKKIGIDKLVNSVTKNLYLDKSIDNNDILIVNVRHRELLIKAYEGVNRLINGYRSNIPNEFLAVDFSDTIENLGKITGDVSGEDLLNRIFSKFCIGK